MKTMKASCASLLVLAVAFVSRADAAEIPKQPGKWLMPLLSWGQFPTLLTTSKCRAELKFTKDQEPDLEKCMKKWRVGFGHKLGDISKATGKQATFEELEKASVDDMFELLAKTFKPEQVKRMKQIMRQECGMDIFEHKEIRDSLNLKAEEIPRLRKIHGELIGEINGGGKGKYTKEEVGKRFGALLKGVPDKVRAALSPEQRNKLQELLGDQFAP